jgi:hypothetical protein
MRLWIGAVLVITAGALGGCAATGTRFAEVEAGLPTLAAGEGRIIVYRETGFVGAGVRPTIRLNGEAIGDSAPGVVLVADRPAGRHVLSAQTEVEVTQDIDLREGAVAYVQSGVSIGIVVGRPTFMRQSEAAAKAVLPSLVYAGPAMAATRSSPPPIAAAGTPPAASADPLPARTPEPSQAKMAEPPTDRARSASSATTLEDLRDLLPPAR